MQCLILAGGLGTRMYPVTETVPKSLIPVHGQPFLGYQLELLASKGMRKVVLSIGHLGEQIRDFAGNGSRWDLEIAYCDEGLKPFGTGGAIRLAYDRRLLDPPFFVVYGDSYTEVPFTAVHATLTPAYFTPPNLDPSAFTPPVNRVPSDLRAATVRERATPLATMVIIRNGDRWDRSNVLFENGQMVVYDKTRRHPRSAEMRHIDYGVSLLSEEAVRRLPEGPGDLSSLFHSLSVDGLLSGYEVSNRFYEIGSPKGLDEFSAHLIETEGVKA